MKGFLSRTKARLGKKIGPLPMWAWAGLVVGALIYWQRRKYATAAATSPAAVGSAGSSGGDYWTGGGSSNGGGSSGDDTSGGSPVGGRRRKHHPPRRRHHHRRHRRHHPAPVGGGGAAHVPSPLTSRLVSEPVGRTQVILAAPVGMPSGPVMAPNTVAHAVPPPGRPQAVVQHARHTVARAVAAPDPGENRGLHLGWTRGRRARKRKRVSGGR